MLDLICISDLGAWGLAGVGLYALEDVDEANTLL